MSYKQVEVSVGEHVVQSVSPSGFTTVQVVEVYPVGVEAANPANQGEAIRDDFIYFLCCAFSCGNCDLPFCCGGRSECTFCCIENSSVCLKSIVDDPTTCFICQSGGMECVHPRKCYSEYYQLCCFECYAAFPPIKGKFKKIHDRTRHNTNTFAPSGDVTLCNGAACCLTSCNCNFPSCLGLYLKHVCLCTEMEATYYKPMCCTPEKRNKDTWCIFFNGHFACINPSICYKSIDQCCCCDQRCALPTDSEVPCMWGLLPFCSVLVNGTATCLCCATLDQLVRASHTNSVWCGCCYQPPSGGSNGAGSGGVPQHYQLQQVQGDMGGSPYSTHGSSHGSVHGSTHGSTHGSPYLTHSTYGTSPGTVPFTANPGRAYGSSIGSGGGNLGSAIQYEAYDQHEHQYKHVEHSAPSEVQMVVAYEV